MAAMSGAATSNHASSAGCSSATDGPRELLALSQLRLRLRRGGRAPARRFPTGNALGRCARRLGLPRLRCPRQDRFRAGHERRLSASAATIGGMSAGRTPYQEATRELLRKTVFDAARDQLGRQPWSEITMADIASGAGVSRQTLYNEFGNRNEFGFAFVIHEAERFMDDVEGAVLEHRDDPRAAVLAALEHFLRTAGGDPLIPIPLHDGGPG